MYAYCYLSWRLNCPHQPEEARKKVQARPPSPVVVFNLIFEQLVEQFGPGSVDECETDYKGECLQRILEQGKSWGFWPETPRVGEWKSNLPDAGTDKNNRK